MCGITGFLNRAGLSTDAPEVCKRMLAHIQHRGPDESGVYTDALVALGSVRLSIVDLEGGQQPMTFANERYWLVYNGEVFNHPELRQELSQLGHRFKGHSDTEVLLHAWQEYGPACLQKLNGQFAFALWDRQKEELFLARDRSGIRPLYYFTRGQQLLFTSEVKALLAHPDFSARLNHGALAQTFTFWAPLSPQSVFEGIQEVPPGHYLQIAPHKTSLHRWWQLTFPATPEAFFQGSFDEACEELRSLLTDAVRLRLRADVPVAAYLSGGLDSSATTALIKELAPDNLQTFSIGFEDEEFDETPYQQEVSAFLNTRHQAFTCRRSDIGQLFPEVIWHAESPILRTAPVPMFCLSRKVREQQIKVVITGEGADEMLGGYDIFKEALIRDFWAREPESRLRPLLLNRLYPYLQQFKGRNQSMLRLFYGYRLKDTDSPLYSHLLRWKNTANLLHYCSADLRDTLSEQEALQQVSRLLPPDFDQWERLGQAQWLEINTFMSPYLLSSQGDRVAMGNSVEGRYPFLDYRVMEFCATLPPQFKMRGLNEKFILKKMMAGRLPQSVLQRPKQAYRAPVSRSFLEGKRPDYVNDLLSPQALKASGLFDVEKAEKLLSKIQHSPMVSEIDNMALAALLSTQLLHQQFVHRSKPVPVQNEPRNCRTLICLTPKAL